MLVQEQGMYLSMRAIQQVESPWLVYPTLIIQRQDPLRGYELAAHLARSVDGTTRIRRL